MTWNAFALAVGLLSSVAKFTVQADCLPTIPLVLDDIHDGDQKRITATSWPNFVIQSYPNTSMWIVEGTFDINCVALINFNVSGKTGYPPVPLKMSMWVMESIAIPAAVKLGFEFTDPSATLAPRTQPINIWTSPALTGPDLQGLKLPTTNKSNIKSDTCGIYTPHGKAETFYDMVDVDEKAVTVKKDKLTIKPYDNNETWVVESTLDSDCVATVDFRVPGKPNPPSTSLKMSVWGMASIAGADKQGLVYTEPLANPVGSPLNVWVPGNN